MFPLLNFLFTSTPGASHHGFISTSSTRWQPSFIKDYVLSWSWHWPKLHLEQGTVSLIAFFLIKPRDLGRGKSLDSHFNNHTAAVIFHWVSDGTGAVFKLFLIFLFTRGPNFIASVSNCVGGYDDINDSNLGPLCMFEEHYCFDYKSYLCFQSVWCKCIF